MISRLLDRLYSRFDLWHSLKQREADYAKVRGFIFYVFALCMLAWEMVVLHQLIGAKALKTFPIGQITVQLIVILAYSLGERVFMAFLHAWSNRIVPDDATAELQFEPHQWANGDPDEGVM